MNKEKVYQQLEEKLVKYQDLIGIPVEENEDAFLILPEDLSTPFGVVGRYEALGDMKEQFPLIPIRNEVKLRLDLADQRLKELNSDLQLVVAYGYRSLEVQEIYFLQQKAQYARGNREEKNDIDEIIHRLIAVPSVAGHPTGGAVDVYIERISNGEKLDFGLPIFTFDSKDVYAFSPFISDEAKSNRQLLRNILIDQNFAPYDGEWWHFSFGDKEWAYYYQQPSAFYEQKSEKIVSQDLVKQSFSLPALGVRNEPLVFS